MVDVKISASIIFPGRVLPAEPRLLKKTRKERKKEKQNEMISYRQEIIHLEKGKPIVINLREAIPASQVIHLSSEAYSYMSSPDNPTPGVKIFEWKKLSKNKRVKLHLQITAESLGGKLESFAIMED